MDARDDPARVAAPDPPPALDPELGVPAAAPRDNRKEHPPRTRAFAVPAARVAAWWRTLPKLQRIIAATLLILAVEATRRASMFCAALLGDAVGFGSKMTAKGALELVHTGYINQLETNPLFTKMVMSMWLYALSDLIVQTLFAPTKPHTHLDVDRLLRFTWFGVFLVTPFLSVWHQILDDCFQPDASLTSACYAALVNQAVVTPIITSTYFVYEATVMGAPMRTALFEMRHKGLRMVLYAWAFWLPCDAVNFTFVPLQHRILYICAVGLVWNVIFTYSARRPTQVQRSTPASLTS